MAARKLTIGEKKAERAAKKAAAPKPLGKSPLEKLKSQINQRLDGSGFVFLGSDIQQREYQRRSSGIPSIDYITCGGYPRGGLVEFGGEFSTGKTSVALESCAHEQRTEGGNIGWIALEPFSKRWARERGFWLPFSEVEAPDVEGSMRPIDPYENASELELQRMEQLGITDPYERRGGEFMLVQEERGDVALDCALDMIKSNQFAIVVVDSLGVAKSTKWIQDNEVQDAGDFPREAKMIGDYTTRALLALNKKYDSNNMEAKDGANRNQTTILHLNQIVTAVGTQAYAKHKTQSIKGGEGNKHNHHAIIFLWKGDLHQLPAANGKPAYRYAQEVKAICLKSKLGPPQMEGSFDFYFQPYGSFLTGDFDRVKDLVNLALVANVITRSGAWYQVGEDLKTQGLESMISTIRDNPDWYAYIAEETRKALKR